MERLLQTNLSKVVFMFFFMNTEILLIAAFSNQQGTSSTYEADFQHVSIPDLNKNDEAMKTSIEYEETSAEIDARVENVIAKSRMDLDERGHLAKGMESGRVAKRRSSTKSRTRHRNLGPKRKACPTRTRYVTKTTAQDMFGKMVDVYPVINIGGLAIDQYFHETFCDVEKCSCAGIGNKKFKSACRTTHSYTYARVVKSGEVGWGRIKVRSGCSENGKRLPF